MDEPRQEWAAPAGWGPPSPPEHPPGASQGQPSYGQPGYGQPGYGQPGPPPYGTQPPAYGAPPPPYGAWGGRPPDLKPGVVPLRPLGLGEILDGAVGILRRYPRPALGLSALVALVSTLVNVLFLVTAFDPFLQLDPAQLESGDTEALEGALGGLAAGGLLTVLVSLLSSVVLGGVITVVVGRAVLGQPLTVGEAWSAVRPHLLRLLGLALLVLVICFGVIVVASVVAGVLVAVGGNATLLLGVPLVLAGIAAAIYLYYRFALAPCALVLERVGIRSSLRRSGVLAKGDWWRIFGILLLTALIASSVGFVLQLPFQFGDGFAAFTGDLEGLSTTALVVSSIGGGIALTLTAPFSAGVRALLYVDRRMRAEGLDVALAASATGTPPPGSAGPSGGL